MKKAGIYFPAFRHKKKTGTRPVNQQSPFPICRIGSGQLT